MTSSINYASINENFPVAGQDNDTQVFRENFTTIKGNFEAAYNEINALQTRTAGVITTEVLADIPNNFPGGVDFGGRIIQNASFINNVSRTFNGGTSVTGNTELSFTNGEYQYFALTGDTTFNVKNAPSTGLGKMTIELTGNGSGHTVTFTIDGGGTVFKKNAAYPGTLTVTSSSNPIIIDVWYRPGNGVVFLEYKGLFA